jgi:hypothetical protein
MCAETDQGGKHGCSAVSALSRYAATTEQCNTSDSKTKGDASTEFYSQINVSEQFTNDRTEHPKISRREAEQ